METEARDIHPTRNPFAVFATDPSGVSFQSLEKGERIVLLLRAHPITLVPTLMTIIFFIFLPSLLPLVLAILDINIFDSLGGGQVFLMAVFWYLFAFGYAFYKFIIWYFNVYLLTNERIIDIDFRGILHKETSYAHLSQVQDVNPKIIGFFGTIFHFGNVYIQTAAQIPEFEFHAVEKPAEVSKEILIQVNKERAEAPGEVS